MELNLKPGASELQPGWAKRKVLLHVLLFAMFLTAVHFLYVMSGGCPCMTVENCVFTFGNAGFFTFGTLSSVSPSDGLTALKPRYNFQFHEEEAQMSNPKLRKLWTSRDWRRKVGIFSDIFQDLMKKNLLKSCDKALCIGAGIGQEVLALKEMGVQESIGIDLVASPPLVMKGDMHRQPFKKNTFDFEFSNVFDHALFTSLFAAEIERTLKPNGLVVIHLMLNKRGGINPPNNLRNVDALIALFRNFDVVHIGEINAFGLDTEVVFRKRLNTSQEGHLGVEVRQGAGLVKDCASSKVSKRQDLPMDCSVSKRNQKIIEDAEPLILEEPQKPWITWKQNLKNIKYLPHSSDITKRRSHVYVDVGARNYGSSIGSWFQKEYPKQNQSFLIYAVEADKVYAKDYMNRPNVKLLPYAAWTRNESLLFGSGNQEQQQGERGMGRIQHRMIAEEVSTTVSPMDPTKKKQIEVQGLDFAEWLMKTVSADDFVVLKMDVEGTEFDLLPRMFETGAICLVDELFLECHYNRWQRTNPQRTSKYDRTYGECFALFESLRASGVLVHQWW